MRLAILITSDFTTADSRDRLSSDPMYDKIRAIMYGLQEDHQSVKKHFSFGLIVMNDEQDSSILRDKSGSLNTSPYSIANHLDAQNGTLIS